MYSIYVDDFMVHDVMYIYKGICYQKLKDILKVFKSIFNKQIPIGFF